jgi:hypothetical protein
MAPRRKFERKTGERRYRKLFLVAAEGCKTEPIYFRLLDTQHATVHVSCIKGGHDSAPAKVLKRMKDRLASEGLRAGDEAWLVVDKDQWSEEQLATLWEWSRTNECYGFALSNPMFEYWLLLHFEDGTGVSSSRQCSEKLARYMPNYDKGFDTRTFSIEMIREAILRAENRDRPPCDDWPRGAGTTVYKLVQRILSAGDT